MTDQHSAPGGAIVDVTPPCPVCGGATSPVLRAPDLPALANAFFDSAAAARAAARGTMDLVVCECGMLTNAAFDEEVAPYSSDYENSLHFSPRFQELASDLAARLGQRYGGPGRSVLEIGSGAGDFLALLAPLGFERGTGIDPSLPAAREELAGAVPLTFLPTTIDGAPAGLAADLLVLRHVLEHVTDPVGLLRAAREHVARPGAALYVEVPDAAHMLRAPAVWDLIYEHVGYITAPALVAALEAAGWDVVEVGTAFGGQFLWAEAVAREGAGPGHAAPITESGGAIAQQAESFAAAYAGTTDRWRRVVAAETAAGRRIAVWGAGSKGVAFLNAVAPDADAVVDVNPRKQGRYVPGTGHRVVGPNELGADIETIFVMNPLYVDEVRDMARAVGVRADVVAVEG